MVALNINGKRFDVDVEPETPLLWVLRDTLGLTGTKFGCGAAICGACTVHVDGSPMRSCALARRNAWRSRDHHHRGHRRRRRIIRSSSAWIEEQVPQCGYCQAGQIMTATALLARNPKPSDADIDREMTNICRCGTYAEIRDAHPQGGRPDGERLTRHGKTSSIAGSSSSRPRPSAAAWRCGSMVAGRVAGGGRARASAGQSRSPGCRRPKAASRSIRGSSSVQTTACSSASTSPKSGRACSPRTR